MGCRRTGPTIPCPCLGRKRTSVPSHGSMVHHPWAMMGQGGYSVHIGPCKCLFEGSTGGHPQPGTVRRLPFTSMLTRQCLAISSGLGRALATHTPCPTNNPCAYFAISCSLIARREMRSREPRANSRTPSGAPRVEVKVLSSASF